MNKSTKKTENLAECGNKSKPLLPDVFSSVDEAIKLLKLDKRHKWYEFYGELIYDSKWTIPCSGCSCDCSDGYGCNHGSSGCSECGYTGKRKSYYPTPAFMPDGGVVKIFVK
jgi:hypothetical protein